MEAHWIVLCALNRPGFPFRCPASPSSSLAADSNKRRRMRAFLGQGCSECERRRTGWRELRNQRVVSRERCSRVGLGLGLGGRPGAEPESREKEPSEPGPRGGGTRGAPRATARPRRAFPGLAPRPRRPGLPASAPAASSASPLGRGPGPDGPGRTRRGAREGGGPPGGGGRRGAGGVAAGREGGGQARRAVGWPAGWGRLREASRGTASPHLRRPQRLLVCPGR